MTDEKCQMIYDQCFRLQRSVDSTHLKCQGPDVLSPSHPSPTRPLILQCVTELVVDRLVDSASSLIPKVKAALPLPWAIALIITSCFWQRPCQTRDEKTAGRFSFIFDVSSISRSQKRGTV